MTIYFSHKLGLERFRFEFLDIFVFLIIIGSYYSVSSIKKVLKLKNTRDIIISKGKTKEPKITKIYFPSRTRFVEFDIGITSKNIEIFKGKN